MVQVPKISIDLIHHPVRSIKGSFAMFVLMSRPPLLARRGDDDFYSLSLNANNELPAAIATYCFPSTM